MPSSGTDLEACLKSETKFVLDIQSAEKSYENYTELLTTTVNKKTSFHTHNDRQIVTTYYSWHIYTSHTFRLPENNYNTLTPQTYSIAPQPL